MHSDKATGNENPEYTLNLHSTDRINISCFVKKFNFIYILVLSQEYLKGAKIVGQFILN